MVLSRVRPSIWIPILMVLWGTVSAVMCLVKTPSQLIAVRFVLGVTEAGFSPAVLFMISNWYRRHEQSKRFMAFLSAGILSGAFGGIIAGAIIDNLDGKHGLAGWQWYVHKQGYQYCKLALTYQGFSSSKALPQLQWQFQLLSCFSTGRPVPDSSHHVNAKLHLPVCGQTVCTLPVVAMERSQFRTVRPS
jgi:MFS family permease